MDIIIKNVRISSKPDPVDIGIEAGKIFCIEPNITAEAGSVIDAGGRAALPGFLEPHLHLEKALLHRRMPARSGTLEEAIEILSWRRLGLHSKPIVFLSPGGFWSPLFAQFTRFIDHSLSPEELLHCVSEVETPEDILPTLRAADPGIAVALHMPTRT